MTGLFGFCTETAEDSIASLTTLIRGMCPQDGLQNMCPSVHCKTFTAYETLNWYSLTFLAEENYKHINI